MYAEQILVDRLANVTGYTVKLTESVLLANVDVSTVFPIIYFGHVAIKPAPSVDIWVDFYRNLPEKELLISQIQIVSLRSNFHIVRATIRSAYKGFNPFPENSMFSGLGFLEGEVKEINSKLIIWNELIGLIMPRTNDY